MNLSEPGGWTVMALKLHSRVSTPKTRIILCTKHFSQTMLPSM